MSINDIQAVKLKKDLLSLKTTLNKLWTEYKVNCIYLVHMKFNNSTLNKDTKILANKNKLKKGKFKEILTEENEFKGFNRWKWIQRDSNKFI